MKLTLVKSLHKISQIGKVTPDPDDKLTLIQRQIRQQDTLKVEKNGRNDGVFFTKDDRQHGGLENAPHQVRQVVLAQGTLEHQEELVEPDRKFFYFFK
jgi:hypothetical protein